MKAKRTRKRIVPPRKGVAIIGAGNWGSSLASAAIRSKVPLLEVVVRRTGRAGVAAGAASAVAWRDAVLDAETIWICVPDGETPDVAASIIARRPQLHGQVVIHSSGAFTVAALEAAKQAGARVGAAAPVFTFPTREPVALTGVAFAVEAAPSAWRKISGLVRELGGRPFRISAETKVLYHAAATMASPLLASALHAAVTTARVAGLRQIDAETVVASLARATLQNYFERGSRRSFSGAFARGDTQTIELHLEALLPHPTLHKIYLALARNAVNSFPVRDEAGLKRLLAERERLVGS